MSQFPHDYQVSASGDETSLVTLSAESLPDLSSAPPAVFGGPGDQWSPEDLMIGAVADCFILSFRAIARASKFNYQHLECTATGTLDRVERQVRFTELKIHAELQIAADSDQGRAQNLLEKAEKTCFITNSLIAEPELTTQIKTG